MKRFQSLLVFTFIAGCHWFGGGKDADSYDDGGVFDARGKRHDCRRGPQGCDKVKEASDKFSDACDEAGFRIVRCGCAEYCTGNPVDDKLHYDRKNVGKDCEPAKESCELPESSGVFQDACTDVGGQLVQCGCEWRCTRKLKGPVEEAPPPDESETPPPEGEDPATEKSEKSEKSE